MKYKASIILLLIIILIPIITNARYFEKIQNIKGKGTIAEPIFKVENLQDTITQTINKESKINEYIFKVKNYELQADGSTKRISEASMSYNIQIINQNANFPIKYELYELEKTENLLNENDKTEEFIIDKNKEYEKSYKLIVFWENKENFLDSSDNLKIIVNSSQIK